ncbi:GNAT family N-acetyltransferase [Bradyrhizobium sp. Rc3b]|uniref:GNAT family N-acetyltransferase n=1 Tax=Bradyrhizobium sp. Rc3b TaxID=1855322 RepID=UPI001FCD55AB|nr:GNAT family N-acetyltransferase [Bradyrhizobium sp. Rc3b]
MWSVREGDDVVGIGALKELGNGGAEVKSMRTHPDHLRRGVAALLLDHIVREAKARGLTRLSLETGSGPAFEPALALYRKRGFVNGEAFAGERLQSIPPPCASRLSRRADAALQREALACFRGSWLGPNPIKRPSQWPARVRCALVAIKYLIAAKMTRWG